MLVGALGMWKTLPSRLFVGKRSLRQQGPIVIGANNTIEELVTIINKYVGCPRPLARLQRLSFAFRGPDAMQIGDGNVFEVGSRECRRLSWCWRNMKHIALYSVCLLAGCVPDPERCRP